MDAEAGTPPRKIDIATCAFAASSLLVNTVAFIGQYGYASEHLGWGRPGDVLYAATIESIAVNVAAHAHASQKKNDSALRTKMASYALGIVVGALNYSHYAPHWHPTAKAVSLGLLSAASPWLWGMFSRRVSRDILMANEQLDGRAVKLGATRWSWHPVLSFRAMRWATWRGEQKPAVAIAAVEPEAGSRKQLAAEEAPAAGNGNSAETETETAAPPVPRQRSGNGSPARPGGNGNGTAEVTAGTGPPETETAPDPGQPGNGTEAVAETEAPAPGKTVLAGSLTLVAADDADTMRLARKAVKADPGILDRFGGPTELGAIVGVTGRRGRQLAEKLRAEREPADEAEAL